MQLHLLVSLLLVGAIGVYSQDACGGCQNGVCDFATYTCMCNPGYFGKQCEESVCNKLTMIAKGIDVCTAFGQGALCVGDIEDARICSCRQGSGQQGPFCYRNANSVCQRKKELADVMMTLLRDRYDPTWSSLQSLIDPQEIIDLLKDNSIHYLQKTECDGTDFASVQCEVSLDNLNVSRCYCADTSTGKMKQGFSAQITKPTSCETPVQMVEQRLSGSASIMKPWLPGYDQTNSADYMNLRNSLTSALTSLFQHMEYFSRVSIVDIRRSDMGNYVSFRYAVIYMVPDGTIYEQLTALQISANITLNGIRVDGYFYQALVACQNDCLNQGTCYSGICYCINGYSGYRCEIEEEKMLKTRVELQMEWKPQYYYPETPEYQAFNASLTMALTNRFSTLQAFRYLIVTKLELSMSHRMKRQATPGLDNVTVEYEVYFSVPVASLGSQLNMTVSHIANTGLMIGNVHIYPRGFQGCTSNSSCYNGYCAHGNCICYNGFVGKRCENSTGMVGMMKLELTLMMYWDAEYYDGSSPLFRQLNESLARALKEKYVLQVPEVSFVIVHSIEPKSQFLIRKRRQSDTTPIRKREVEIEYFLFFHVDLHMSDPRIARVTESINRDGLMVDGQLLTPPYDSTKLCEQGLSDSGVLSKFFQSCFTPLSAVNQQYINSSNKCRLYYATLYCFREILHDHDYECSYGQLDNASFVSDLMSNTYQHCSANLPSESMRVKPLCRDSQLLASYSVSTLCIAYASRNNMCGNLESSVVPCIKGYSNCDSSDIIEALIDYPLLVQTRLSYNFSTCPRPKQSQYMFNNSVSLKMAWRSDLYQPSSAFYMSVHDSLVYMIGEYYAAVAPMHHMNISGFRQVPEGVQVNFQISFAEDVTYKKYELTQAKRNLEASQLHVGSEIYDFIQTVNKTGRCPAPGVGICVEACSGDDSCFGAQKCCSNGCGHVCTDPVTSPSCTTYCANGATCFGNSCYCAHGWTGHSCDQLVQNATHSVHLIVTFDMIWQRQFNTSWSWKQDMANGLKAYFRQVRYFKDLVVDKVEQGSTVVYFRCLFTAQPDDDEIRNQMASLTVNGVTLEGDMTYVVIRTDDCRNYDKMCLKGGWCTHYIYGQFKCECPLYSAGERCEHTDYGDCRAPHNSCYHGKCMKDHVRGNYTCMCDYNYQGRRCENYTSTMEPCRHHSCQNGGSCISTVYGPYGSYNCSCPRGYTGKYCERSFCDDLPFNPCGQYGGDCKADFDKGQLCVCPTQMVNGYYVTGVLCDALSNRPDYEMPVCHKMKNMSDIAISILKGELTFPGFVNASASLTEILLRYGYQTVRQPECDGSGTVKRACETYVTPPYVEKCYCTDNQLNMLSGMKVSYNGMPSYCPAPGDTCYSSSQCENNGTCYSMDDRSFCSCPVGFQGRHCEISDVHPCATNPCANNFHCSVHWDGSYDCGCEREWGFHCTKAPYWYCNCSPQEKCVREEKCLASKCWRQNKCVPYHHEGPCDRSPCNNNGMCIETNQGNQHTCECYHGYSGVDCEIVDSVCDIVAPLYVCGAGRCVGDIDNGEICRCPRGWSGAFCEKQRYGGTACERQKDVYDAAWDILNGETVVAVTNAKEIVRNLTLARGVTAIPVINCTASGDFAPQQCNKDIFTHSETCHCVNSRGEPLYQNVTTMPGLPPCTAPDPNNIAKLICTQMNMCLNGATCVGQLQDATPQLCACPYGYEGMLCERRTEDGGAADEYTMCTFSRDAYRMMKSLMNGEFNLTIMGTTITGDMFMQTFRSLMAQGIMMNTTSYGVSYNNYSSSMAVLKPNCTESGEFATLQCEYDLRTGRREVCYCFKPNGMPVPGTREMAPRWPNCDAPSPCSHVMCMMYCPNGFRKNWQGCPICECREMCETMVCPKGTRCVAGHSGEECKQTHKRGMCPMEAMADIDSLIEMFEDTQDTCQTSCRDDADCSADMKCCGACGNKCVLPYLPENCMKKKEAMVAHWELYQSLSKFLNNRSDEIMHTANRTFPAVMHNAVMWVKNTKHMWKPSCDDNGGYMRRQCEYDLKTNRPVNCFCADRDGHRINGTDVRPPRTPVCDAKPGMCPMSMDSMTNSDMYCMSECRGDYDCYGRDKCCMKGCHRLCQKPLNESMPESNITAVLEQICPLITSSSYCKNGGSCVGSYETGDLCMCQDGYKGPLCDEMLNPGERLPTLCEKRRAMYEVGRNFGQFIYEVIRTNSFVVPKATCTEDGAFTPTQCKYDIMSNKRKYCYCVHENGYPILGTKVPSPQWPQCGVMTCDVGNMYYRHDADQPMMCDAWYNKCPYGYECKQVAYGRRVCCLSHHGHQDICKQTMNPGKTCKDGDSQTETPYYYNMTLKRCEKFEFRGCYGNENNFPTEAACNNRCIQKVKPGMCPRVAASSVHRNCKDECDNDGKCHEDKKCCMTDCGQKCLNPKIDSEKRKCKVGWQYTYFNGTDVYCGQGRDQCPEGYDCIGKEGTSICCPEEDKHVDICHQPKLSGPCQAYNPMYYFNRKTEQCEEFIYGGCGGNDNAFRSLEECCFRCGTEKSQCKPGMCPVPKTDRPPSCASRCKSDNDCYGDSRCCSNGCGRTCVLPEKNMTMNCHTKLREAHMQMKMMKPDKGCSWIFMPRCNKDGSWKQQQCLDSLGLCWCVKPHGMKVAGSMVRGYAECHKYDMHDKMEPKEMTDDESDDSEMTMEPHQICPAESKMHCCSPALCQMHTCPAHPSAVCRVNPCGGCKVEFFDHQNKKVNCHKGYAGCNLAYAKAKRWMKQTVLNKMMGMPQDPAMGMMNVTEIIRKHMMPKFVPDPVELPSKCLEKPETGMCRAYMPSWFYNHTSNRCEKFIYGGCGGNDNRFATVDECYEKCHKEAHPCMTSKCLAVQKCTIAFDAKCDIGKCAHWAECSYVFNEPHVSGVIVPTCLGQDYTQKQCHHDFCWCVTKDGMPIEGSIANKGDVTCKYDGTYELTGDNPARCPNGKLPDVNCLHQCMGKVCPGKPNATCTVNLCDPMCSRESYKVKFMDGPKEVECGGDECSVVYADAPPEKCQAMYPCPGGTQPKLCPVSVCQREKCWGNLCAKCSVDPCTCKAVFTDILTNETVTDCSKVSHTPCEEDLCGKKMQMYKEKLLTGKTTVVLPVCNNGGSYTPKQCLGDYCHCVDGKGQTLKEDVLFCERNETVSVTIKFKFNEDFSFVRGNIEGFKAKLIDAIVKQTMIEGAEDFISEINIEPGSILVTVVLEDSKKPEDPSPYLVTMGDTLVHNVKSGNMKVDYNGQVLVADQGALSRTDRYEGDDVGPQPPPEPEPEPGLSLPVIIAIAVGAGIIGVILFAVLIYCCCCRDTNGGSSTASHSSEEFKPYTTPDPMVTGHSNATYGVPIKSPMDNMAYSPDDDIVKVRM